MKGKPIEINKESVLGSPGTLAIIFINIMAFVAQSVIPELGKELLLIPDINRIIERPWTLVTVFFSHEILFHLIANMAMVFVFGIQLEKLTSSKTVLFIYFIAGLLGSLATIPIAPLMGWTGTVVGASAAAWGVVAAFGGMRPNTNILGGKAIIWVLALFISNTVLAISNPQMSIGAGAHYVGIAVGLICGFLLKKNENNMVEAPVKTHGVVAE